MAFQVVTVQVNDSDHLSTQVFLDGESFGLDFYTTKVPNLADDTVAECWYLDLYDSAGEPLVLGIGLAAGIDILFPYRARAVPKGKLFVNPEGGSFVDPTVDSFKDALAVLYYQPAASVTELGVSG